LKKKKNAVLVDCLNLTVVSDQLNSEDVRSVVQEEAVHQVLQPVLGASLVQVNVENQRETVSLPLNTKAVF
jgi:hypothetical protein